MINDVYRAIFEDIRRCEITEIHNNGREICISLQGIDFIGNDFDSLSPVGFQLELARSKFTLQHNVLCSCRLKWTMPLVLLHQGNSFEGILGIDLILGNPLPNGGIDLETVTLELTTPTQTVRSTGASGWFEDELLELASNLGDATLIHACITCAFSDYSPYGHGLFGYLACFRDAKEEYAQVKGKAGIFVMWNRMTEFVQETHLCCEYSR
jgi:hypothetical protein